jgi:hypothetical protein
LNSIIIDPVNERTGAVNKFISVALVVALLAACVAGYWYINPQHLPGYFRRQAPGLQVPTPNSPVNNFRPPQF